MQALTEGIPFQRFDRAAVNFRGLAAALSEEMFNKIRRLVAMSADPDAVLHYFEKLRLTAPGDFERLTGDNEAATCLASVFSHSQFLSEEVLRRPFWLDELLASGGLHAPLSQEQMIGRLERDCPGGVPDALSLATFRRL